MSSNAPSKFILDPTTDVRKINPSWKGLIDTQINSDGATRTPPQMANLATALPVVTSIEDHCLNLPGTQLAESVLLAEDVAPRDGCEDPLARIQHFFARYEVPLGLLNKLMCLSDFQVMEMIIDDSGSMSSKIESKLPDGSPMTRWQEVATVWRRCSTSCRSSHVLR